MEWTRSDTLALANPHCPECRGLGLRLLNRGGVRPCACVFRAIFRACYARFRRIVTEEGRMSQAVLEYSSRGCGRTIWGRKDEEYVADFLLVSKRHLNPDEYQVFRYHFLLGADYNLCCKRLGMEKGPFFHMIYRIMRRLGRVYRELKPYALYPIDEYFNGRTENEIPATARMTLVPVRPIQRSLHEQINVPVRKAA
jgi:hypothetical protein